MSTNVGAADRRIRIALGLGLISLALWGPKAPWGRVGLIPLLTAFIGFCPDYGLLGIQTCKS